MNKICNKKIIVFLMAVFLAIFIFVPTVLAAAADEAMTGLNEAAAKGYTGETEGKLSEAGIVLSLSAVIGKIIGVALSLIGVAFLILMIYGGFTWMVARGNEQEATKAKDLIQAAIIGLVIVLGAYAITKFVGQQLL